MTTLIEHDDVLDVRDLAALAREIHDETSGDDARHIAAEERNTQDVLRGMLDDLGIRWDASRHAGTYPWQEWLGDALDELADSQDATIVAADYWLAYAQQLADDVAPEPGGVFGVIDERYRDAWPYRYVTIDWSEAADALRADYSEFDLDGHAYLIRS